ncbi:anti-sigma factor [Cryobacterium tepidiphilum]|uniref:Regulator of SigK n=1 Tax=Cryobacterium tepidiphilum TaxID=2486026 RepID=A0A3M8LG03_9MICO|nr:anti-sigma factor [Cryobacterium tepidiphilum]RNE63614.1 anti-sigma factor [Cryobacterium tepidiphilum]
MTNDDSFDPGAQELSGAYALDAVSPQESADFEKARRASADVDREADEFAETASLLGLATTPVTPSARMKSDLMAKIAVTPQRSASPSHAADEPATAGVAADTSDAVQADAVTTTGGDVARRGLRHLPRPEDRPGAAPAASRGRLSQFPRPLRYLAAAAAAVVLFVTGGLVGTSLTGGTTANVNQAASALADIMAQDDAQKLSQPMGDGTATLVWSGSLGRSAVLVEDLPALSDDKVYEAWYIDGSGARAAGTFRPSADTATWHVLDGTMTSGSAVGVTVEPEGGSEQPTTDPVLVMKPA